MRGSLFVSCCIDSNELTAAISSTVPEVRAGALLQGGVQRRRPQAGVVASAVDRSRTELAGQQQVAEEELVGRLYEGGGRELSS